MVIMVNVITETLKFDIWNIKVAPGKPWLSQGAKVVTAALNNHEGLLLITDSPP